MDANVTLDVGKNITGLIQQLAAQIGVTADKIFPLYVKQTIITGYTHLSLTLILFFIPLILGAFLYKKADFDNGNGPCVIFIICCIVLVLDIISLVFGLPTMIGQINNPEYFATQELIHDISMLAAK